MDCNGVYDLIMERKEDEYVFGTSFMSGGINFWFYKESTKFSELISFYYIQKLNWGENMHLLDLLMKYEKLGEYWLKNTENWAKQV